MKGEGSVGGVRPTHPSAANGLLRAQVFSTNPFWQELKVVKYLLLDRTSFPPAPSPVLANGQAALGRWESTVAMLLPKTTLMT